MFRYDWSRFDAKLGLIFMVGTILVFNLMGRFDFAVYAAGVSALLAWITIILVPRRRWSQHLLGLVIYLIVGAALTWLAYIAAPYSWGRLASMAIVTFAGYLMLLRGPHPFMVAWCLVYWYLLTPLFLGDGELGAVMLAHVVGVSLVIALNLLKPIWSRATGKAATETEAVENSLQDRPAVSVVVRYATVVSLSIVAGGVAGTRWITSDPTLIANATLNMISPSLQQTWIAAVERVIMGSLGIVGGFYFGWFFPEPWVGHLVTAVCSFLALGLLYVNAGLLVGVFFFLISFSWGGMHSDLGHLIANEKLVGELVGVVIAVVAIGILVRLQRGIPTVPILGQAPGVDIRTSQTMPLLRLTLLLLRIAVSFALLFAITWAAAALWIDGPESRVLASMLAGIVVVSTLAAAFVRPWWQAATAVFMLFAIVLAWWLTLVPGNDRDWQPDVAHAPTATIEGSLLTIRNLRNFEYHDENDFTERWETRSYDLDTLVGVDVFISFWGPTLYGHTIMSWEFSDGSHLAISIEARKETGEEYSALRGFFRQFELYYVVADESDLITLRTHHRSERVELYRTSTSVVRDRALLLDYVREMNALAGKPRWYNALTHNCTTTIWHHEQAVGSDHAFDWRLLANGYLVDLAYEHGSVNTSIGLDELKRRSDITGLARSIDSGNVEGFSKAIRQRLPPRAPSGSP